jgi:hypothetical protein
MKNFNFLKAIILVSLCVEMCGSFAFSQTEKDYVKGKLITFNSNGIWCWFQDERAIIDTTKNKIIVGSVESGANIDAVIYDMTTKTVESKTVLGKLSVDDHNAPGFIIAPNGNYIAMFADHYDKYNSHYRIFDGKSWSAEKKFDWNKIPGGTNYTIAYSNLMYLKAEGQIYDFARANNRSPNFLLSVDSGVTWKFGGQLTTDPSSSYNKGYYKYWGNGVDRIDFAFTEQHPRDYTTSIYHGYIANGVSHASDGTVADSNIFDQKNLPTSKAFTKVFANGTKVNGATMGRCWQHDIMRYKDGSIAILFKARADNSETDHRHFYARFDGEKWTTTYLGKAGSKLYAAEQDYTGLGALCPDDPNTIFISTPFDPKDETNLKVHEIFMGKTQDHGATWTWTPITKNSSKDNIRPIVPAWDSRHLAVLWCRGTYSAAQQFNTAIVGILDTNSGVTNSGIQVQTLRSLKDFSIELAGNTTIRFSLLKKAFVNVRIFTAQGKESAIVVNTVMPAGEHTLNWAPKEMPAGMYLCKITVQGVSKIVTVHNY